MVSDIYKRLKFYKKFLSWKKAPAPQIIKAP